MKPCYCQFVKNVFIPNFSDCCICRIQYYKVSDKTADAIQQQFPIPQATWREEKVNEAQHKKQYPAIDVFYCDRCYRECGSPPNAIQI